MQDDFERQFVQDVKMSAPQAGVSPTGVVSSPNDIPMDAPQDGASTNSGNSKILPAILIMTIINTIFIIVLGVGVMSMPRNTKEEKELITTVDDDEEDEEADYIMDKSGNITALRVSCKNKENGASFTFSDDNTYVEQDSSAKRTSGTYSVIRNELVTISSNGKERTLYYDGFFVADGATIYDCE